MSAASDPTFQQSHFIGGIHNIPRFGHSNSISKLASFQRPEQEDYFRGLFAFVAFAVIILYAWSFVLVSFKIILGPTNCAAGGSVLDVARLRKERIPRDVRRRRILRSWRIQWAFLGASILIPITTLLMTRNGLKPLINSLDELESISDEVEAVAFRGLAIAEALQHSRQSLHQNFTDLNLANVCPTSPQQQSNSSILALPISTLAGYVQIGLDEVQGFLDQYADEATNGLHSVVGVTSSLDHAVEWTFQNDWALKFFLLCINVVNIFFLFGCFLSKQDLVFYSYQRFLSYAMIPFFGFLLICSLIIACVFGMTSMINADFCYGNTILDGTMHGIMVNSGVEQSDLTYRAFMHYMEGCIGEHPLDFIIGLDSVIGHIKTAVNLLEGKFDTITPIQFNQHCTEDVHVLIPAIPHLTAILNEVQRQVRAIIELTGCHQISPVLRRILYGVTCSDMVDAMAWLVGGMWCITLLGFTMLSVRAGLHNAVVRAPRRKRQREKEKEFEEYKQYMSTFYEDADRWQIHAPAKTKAALDTIPRIPTFDTEELSISRRHDDEGDGSEIACFASPQKRSDDSSSSSASSYESDYSSDSDDQRSNMSLSMMVGRIFHSRNNMDESQSQLAGISMLSHDTAQSPGLGILELQTPRRRRQRALPAPYLLGDSPSSDESTDHVASPPSFFRAPPAAPSKPMHNFLRAKGAQKES